MIRGLLMKYNPSIRGVASKESLIMKEGFGNWNEVPVTRSEGNHKILSCSL